MTGSTPGVIYGQRTLQTDRRIVADRRDPGNNSGRRDDSILNAVGAVWPYGLVKTGGGYAASTGVLAATGFLIDRCHVLTNMHVLYPDDTVVRPPVGGLATFAVGQTAADKDRGALQGLKYLLEGVVIARGDSIILDRRVHAPEEDWALIRLAGAVDDSITPMTLTAVEVSALKEGTRLASAGYPSDHRARRADGFKLKDLWVSEGRVVKVDPVGDSAALLETTIQYTPGSSGGPVYGDFNGRHAVIGMVQSLAGNGVDASDLAPNVQILFTPRMLERIDEARMHFPCQ